LTPAGPALEFGRHGATLLAMKILQEVCSLPTAPFVEDRVIAYARAFAKERKLRWTQDRFGNALIEVRGTRRSAPRWVFTAHMDHPGFVAERMLDDRTLRATFRGYVFAELMAGERVRFFVGDDEATGKVIEAQAEKKSPRAQSATIQVRKPVPKGSAGMFDQGVGRVKGSKFYSRAIDDLGGLAAALAMLDQIAKKPAESTVAVLLTRAEEEGFIGAIAASQEPELLRQDDRLIAIETSAMQPYAKQGDGCIIRIGDRTSVFNSSLSYFITQVADGLKKKDKAFKYQRALMPGGTCEATVYDVYGFHAGSICVPLGNYHNMDREKGKIGAEYIDVSDWENMVKLFLAVARGGHEYEPGHKLLREKIEKRYEGLKKFLTPTSKA
jgi:endoglucanase